MKTFRLVLLLLFAVALPAQAVWTDEERAELRKVIATAVVIQDVLHDLAAQAPALDNPKDAVTALHLLERTSLRMFSIFNCVTGEGCGTSVRTEQVERVMNHIDALRTHRTGAANALRALGKTVLADRLEALPIDTFNRGLAYLEHRPVSYPDVIKPHGDWDQSEGHIQHAVQYTHHAQFDILRMWQHTNGRPEDATSAIRGASLTAQKLFRAWAINADFAAADDEATALADSKFGSGLRPPPFFRTLLSLEYAFGTGNTIFSGRRSKKGATLDIRVMQDNVTDYLQTLAPEELAQMFAPGTGGAHGTGGSTTWAVHFYNDLTDFWRSMDVWGSDVMLFSRPPLPPPGSSQSDVDLLRTQVTELTVELNLALDKIERALAALNERAQVSLN
jgi:hypothetical protein